jgi:hypothetical protein
MNPEREKELELEISRALHGLPDLAAPPGLLTRTMAALEQPARQQGRLWAKWPLSARIAFLGGGVAAVAAIVVGWGAAEPGLASAASNYTAPLAVGLSSTWKALSALAGAGLLAVEHLGKGFLLAGLVAGAGAWALCAGLGTVLFRLVWARPGTSQL